jgi:hypothetical protein
MMSSLLMTHVLIHFHRNAQAHAEAEAKAEAAAEARPALQGAKAVADGGVAYDLLFDEDAGDFAAEPAGEREGEAASLKTLLVSRSECCRRRPAAAALAAGVLAVAPPLCAGLLVAGARMQSFRISIQGLAGWISEISGGTPNATYSIVSAGAGIAGAAGLPRHAAGVVFLQAVLYGFAVVAPLLLLALLAVLWWAPLRRTRRVALRCVCEALYAWSCVDVFIVALVAAVLQTPQFAQFMIGDSCDAINAALALAEVDARRGRDGDDTCFDVRTAVFGGYWGLVAAAAGVAAFGEASLRLAKFQDGLV